MQTVAFPIGMLKCAQDLFYSGVRHPDMEMTTPRNRSRAGPHGDGPGSVRSRGKPSRAWPRAFIGKEWMRQGGFPESV